jgi:hypothetical protein
MPISGLADCALSDELESLGSRGAAMRTHMTWSSSPLSRSADRPATPWRVARLIVQLPVLAALVLAGPYLLDKVVTHGWRTRLFDFKGGLYNAGTEVIHGHSPYKAGFLAHQAALMHHGHIAVGELASRSFSIPVYPAIANLLAVPYTAFPAQTAGIIFGVLSVAAMLGGLWLLGVRDWRCHLIAVLSWPLIFGVFMGAIGPWLVLWLGVAWRWRDRIWRPAAGLAMAVAIKLFPWTLGAWLLVTRRYKALAATVGLCLLITFGAWAVIGWHGLAQYPQMLQNMSFIQDDRALSVVGVLVIAGLASWTATAIGVLAGLLVLALAWRVAQGPDGDRRAFGLAVLAALTATPIVWEHYMVLLFVPIAVLSPRISAAWLLPLVTPLSEAVLKLVPTLAPAGPNVPFNPDTLRTAIPWLVTELVIGILLYRSGGARSPAPGRARPVPERVQMSPA